MHDDKIFIDSVGTALGAAMPVATALAGPDFNQLEVDHIGQLAVRVASPGTSAADLAALAIQTALSRTHAPLHTVGPLLHAGPFPHEVADVADVSTPTLVHAAAGLPPTCGPAHPSGHGSDSVIRGLLQAASHLRQARCAAVQHALVTASSVCPATLSRWQSYPGIVRGDGAGAVVVSRRSGRAQLLYGTVHRDDVLHALREQHADPNVIDCQTSNLAQLVLAKVLEESGVRCADVRYVITPFARPYSPLRRAYALWPGADEHCVEPFAQLGRTTGHLGAADVICSLDLLGHPDAPIDRGDHVVLLGDDGTDSVAAAVLRF